MLTLRPYQRAAIDGIYDYFGRKQGHPLVVIPTAGGKSLVLAAFIQEVLEQWPDQRILVVTHVRELIAQNFAEMMLPLILRRVIGSRTGAVAAVRAGRLRRPPAGRRGC